MKTLDLIKSHIDAYTRKDGTVVSAHDDKRSKKARADGDGVPSDVSLDHPAYSAKAKLRGYNGATNVHQAVSSRDAANILIRNNPDWTKEDHANLADAHAKAAAAHHDAWGKRVQQAHQETFGKPYSPMDYKVRIARDEYSEDHKAALRKHAQSATKHENLAAAHAAAAKSRAVKG